MEELLLGAFLTYDELDIVDEKDIVVSVFFPEFRGGYVVLITDSVNQLVGKGFRGDVQYLGFCVVL